jgi:hypothetical protein
MESRLYNEVTEMFSILGFTHKQKLEFLNDLKNIADPKQLPGYSRYVDITKIRLEIPTRLVSDGDTKYLVIQFSYPDGRLSIDSFKEYTKLEYGLYMKAFTQIN